MRRIALALSFALVFLIPWENAITVAGMGTLTRVFGFLVAGIWLASVLAGGRLRRLHPFHLLVCLFLFWNVLTLFWSIDVDLTVQQLKTYGQLALLVWILWDLYTTPADLHAALQAYILGAYVSIGSTIYSYVTGTGALVATEGRYAGANLNAVDLALILALGLPVAWHLANFPGGSVWSRIFRVVNYAYIPLALFAMALTGSRMALFAAGPALLYILVTSNRLRPFSRATIMAALVAAALVLRSYLPESVLDRLSTTSSSISAMDLGGRVDIWRQGVAVFLAHPFWGIGSGAFRAAVPVGAVAHNTFLSVLTELGLAGFSLLAGILAIVVYLAALQPKPYRLLWLTLLVVWAVGVFTLTWEVRKPTWLFLGLLVTSAVLFRQRGLGEGNE